MDLGQCKLPRKLNDHQIDGGLARTSRVAHKRRYEEQELPHAAPTDKLSAHVRQERLEGCR